MGKRGSEFEKRIKGADGFYRSQPFIDLSQRPEGVSPQVTDGPVEPLDAESVLLEITGTARFFVLMDADEETVNEFGGKVCPSISS